MDLPVAPPAFDATGGPRPRRSADRGADLGAGCGLVFLELAALVVIFGLWWLSGFGLDPASTVTADPLWHYLIAVGAVGAVALAAAVIAARAGAVVTVATQGLMAALVCLIVVGGTAAQSHEDQRCREIPTAPGCRHTH
ncbi:DUF6234 family protein [Streptomyces sp. NPDC049590]|uniref:DUF6234 family protein n=1 Tax=Streptomyces sp. NPDC049590 TaxID=3154834 RepID=UPI0034471616